MDDNLYSGMQTYPIDAMPEEDPTTTDVQQQSQNDLVNSISDKKLCAELLRRAIEPLKSIYDLPDPKDLPQTPMGVGEAEIYARKRVLNIVGGIIQELERERE